MSIKSFLDYLTETTLSRVWQYFATEKYPAGIMSAWRHGHSAQEQASATKRLANEIRAAGFGFVYADGRYVEAQPPRVPVQVEETALLIHGTPGDNGKLKGCLRKWRAEYDQDATIFKPEGSVRVLLLNRDGSETDIGTFHPNRTSDYMTALRGRSGGSFVFENAYAEMTFIERLAKRAREKSNL
jgi:hypothetical protein